MIVGERRLAETRRSGEQHVIEHVAARTAPPPIATPRLSLTAACPTLLANPVRSERNVEDGFLVARQRSTTRSFMWPTSAGLLG